MDFQGQIAIVTGGAQGIGRAVAEILAERGAKVLIGYIGSHASAEETIQAIEAKGGTASSFYGDISVVDNIKAMFAACIERYGRPDILVANAGLSESRPFLDISEQDYYRVFDVNVKGTLFCVQEAARHLNDNGRIVVVSSSTVRYPVEGMAVYTASKSALHALVEVAAKEVAPRGISINSVLPGLTGTKKAMSELPPEFISKVTEASPFGRLGLPEDVAEAIVLLTSREAHWISGQHIMANGGGRY